MHDELTKWFDNLPQTHMDLAISIREIILECNPELEETLNWKMPNYALDKQVCYIKKNKTNNTLCFQQYAHLKSTDLLEGTGKDVRHVKCPVSKTIDAEKLKLLIHQVIKFDKTSFTMQSI